MSSGCRAISAEPVTAVSLNTVDFRHSSRTEWLAIGSRNLRINFLKNIGVVLSVVSIVNLEIRHKH